MSKSYEIGFLHGRSGRGMDAYNPGDLKEEALRRYELGFRDGISPYHNEPKATRGGPGRGQGRKPLAQGEETIPVTIRLTETQRDMLAALGGPKWVREQIEKSARAFGHFANG